MLRSLLGALLVVLAVLLTDLPRVQAQDKITPNMERRARNHFEKGRTAFELRDFEVALKEYEAAYKIAPLPGLLFNIGQCYRNLGKPREAMHTFRQYLIMLPNAPNRTAVLELIRQLQRETEERETKERRDQDMAPATLAETRSAPLAQERPTDSRTEALPPTTAHVSSKRGWLWYSGWALAGVGAASIVTGAIFGSLVSSKNNEFVQAVLDDQTYRVLRGIRDSGKTYERVELTTLICGAVALAAGGGLLIWELRGKRQARDRSISWVPMGTPGGFGLSLWSQF